MKQVCAGLFLRSLAVKGSKEMMGVAARGTEVQGG